MKLKAIGIDMQRSQRTLQATKLEKQSNSAQDMLKSIEAAGAHHVSLLTKLAGGAYLGFEHGGSLGAAGGLGLGVGEHLLAGIRSSGIVKSNEMVRDAMLDPEKARILLAKAPIRPDQGYERTLAVMLARSAMYSSTPNARPGANRATRP